MKSITVNKDFVSKCSWSLLHCRIDSLGLYSHGEQYLLNMGESAMGAYDEYLERSSWEPSEPLHNWMATRIIQNVISYTNVMPEESLFLEIGAGTGRIARVVKDKNFSKYLGIEPTQALAEFVRSSGDYEILGDSLPNLTLSNNSADITFSLHVLEHAPTWTDAYAWAKEMLRVTKQGGHVVIAAPDYREWKSYFWDADWSHGYPTTPRRVAQMFTDLDGEILLESSLHFGKSGWYLTTIAKIFSILIPTRLVDAISNKIVGRPLASGLKQSLFWGLTFVVIKKTG